MKKITKHTIKTHARKLKHASETEFKEFEEGYQKLMADMPGFSSPMLLLLAVVGICIILLFQSGIFDFVGVVVFLYPFYLFAERAGHQEGYYEGYYDNMVKQGSAEHKAEHKEHPEHTEHKK